MPLLECAREPGREGVADRAALHEHGALPTLRRLAIQDHRSAALRLHALLWCVHIVWRERSFTTVWLIGAIDRLKQQQLHHVYMGFLVVA